MLAESLGEWLMVWVWCRFGYLLEGEDEVFLTDVYGYTVGTPQEPPHASLTMG
jgi:hypothetical protein